MKRREFVKKTALTAGSLVLGKMLGDTPEILADQHKKSCCSKKDWSGDWFSVSGFRVSRRVILVRRLRYMSQQSL